MQLTTVRAALAGIGMAVLAAAVGTPLVASAATTTTPAQTSQYDGASPTHDWGGYNCADTSRVVTTTDVLSTSTRAKVGYVQLRYSPRCATFYSQVYRSIDMWTGYWFSAAIVGGDGSQIYCQFSPPPNNTGGGCYTAMMTRVAGRKYQSKGILFQGSNTHIVAFGQTTFTDSIGIATRSTNADWAQLVLQDGGWPVSSNNVTVMLQWMASENTPARWFNRNNPLNNGLGSGGGAGLGSYDNLTIAAHYAAQNLQSANHGYPAIANDLSVSASPATTARAIWDSSWAESHYGHGGSWHSGAVATVAAPAADWS